ncbi:MAG: septation protein A [Rickettsiaceae bacterium]
MFKFLTEFSPLIAFFVGYKTSGIFDATLYMLIASVISISVTYAVERKINNVNIISTLLLLASASLTLLSGNTTFIKMKPTVLYSLFGSIFLVTTLKWKPAIKYVMGASIKLQDDKKWRLLNIRFMCFFFTMAIVNEIMWRNFSEEAWVNFKVFGAMPITLLFLLTQVPFLVKNRAKDSEI